LHASATNRKIQARVQQVARNTGHLNPSQVYGRRVGGVDKIFQLPITEQLVVDLNCACCEQGIQAYGLRPRRGKHQEQPPQRRAELFDCHLAIHYFLSL
jgi:hypothetical protein